MDNEAPNYAKYMPEAGGYVANGKVVSKSPVYDENGKLKLDVDASMFQYAQPAVQKSVLDNSVNDTASKFIGSTTTNTTGSNTDANSTTTGIGSMGSISQNTDNAVDSAISSPAMRSPSAGNPAVTPEQEVNKEYQDAVARGDLQGQINALSKASRLLGIDYSAEIAELTKQRQKKIETTDDQYLGQLNEAKQRLDVAKSQGDMTGDYEPYVEALKEYYGILEEQGTWRDAVGYQDAMQQKYNQEMIDLDIDYKETWAKSYNDITNQIVQQLPELLNFQYDPFQDTSLRIAQQYATSAVKENAISTGMYYSSMTQNAIARAVAELVPVYQKMAREEAVENFKLLQSTASFLMDAEKQQFDMWKAQIQLKFDAAEEERKQINQAIENANARGYYTNEEAAKLGVAPGTESQAARERALDKQEKIEEEWRSLQQSMALKDFENDLEMQRLREQDRIKRAQLQQEYALRDWENERQAYYTNYYKAMFSESESNAPTYEITVDEDGNISYKLKGTATYDSLTGQYVDASGNALGSNITDAGNGNTWRGIANIYGKDVAQVAKDSYTLLHVSDLDFSDPNVVKKFAEDLQTDANTSASEALTNNINNLKDLTNPNGRNVVGPQQDIKTTVDIAPYLEGTYLEKAKETIAKGSAQYSWDPNKTDKAVNSSASAITNMISSLAQNGSDSAVVLGTADAMYKELFDSIKNAGSDFDFSAGDRDETKGLQILRSKNNVVEFKYPSEQNPAAANQGVKAKEDAMIKVINDIINAGSVPADIKQPLAKSLSQYLYDYASKDAGNDGYSSLKDQANYRYLSPSTVSRIDYDSATVENSTPATQQKTEQNRYGRTIEARGPTTTYRPTI